MQGQAAVQEIQTEHGDKQGAQAEARGGEPLQGHLRPQDKGDCLPRTQIRQLKPPAAEGAVG